MTVDPFVQIQHYLQVVRYYWNLPGDGDALAIRTGHLRDVVEVSQKQNLLRFGLVNCATGCAQVFMLSTCKGGEVIWCMGAMPIQLAACGPPAVSVEEGLGSTLGALLARRGSFMIALLACVGCMSFTQHIPVMGNPRCYVFFYKYEPGKWSCQACLRVRPAEDPRHTLLE